MAQDFVQGFLATITVDGVDQTLTIEQGGLTRSKSVLSKGSMDGTGFAKSIPGPVTGTLDLTGHIVQLNLNDLELAFAKDVPVAFTMTITEGLVTDAAYSGFVTLSQFDVDTSADANWAFQLQGETSGEIVYTPSAVV